MRRDVVGSRASIAAAFGLVLALLCAGIGAASTSHYADTWQYPAESGGRAQAVRQAHVAFAAIGGYGARGGIESPAAHGGRALFSQEGETRPPQGPGVTFRRGDKYAPIARTPLLLLAAMALVVSMVGIAYTPGAGITGTPHDWPCSTCHTLQSRGSSTLLWNVTLAPTPYRWNAISTTAGTSYPTFAGDTYKGSSVVCLSCHDGVISPAISQRGDLSRNHPVAMPFPINGVPSTYNFVRNGALYAKEWVANPMASNGIRLYHDDGSGNIGIGVAVGRTGIECSSCHDVHNGPRVKDQELLTGLLSGGPGYICAQCHAK